MLMVLMWRSCCDVGYSFGGPQYLVQVEPHLAEPTPAMEAIHNRITQSFSQCGIAKLASMGLPPAATAPPAIQSSVNRVRRNVE